MSSLLLPRRFYNQPQGAVSVNWSNPITRGLMDVVFPPMHAAHIPKVTDRNGIAWQQNGSSIYNVAPAVTTTSPNYTVVVIATPSSLNPTKYRIICGRGPKKNGHWELYTQPDSAIPNTFVYESQTGTGASFGDVRDRNVVLSFTRTAFQIRTFVNGSYVSQVTYSSVGFDGSSNVSLTLGDNYDYPDGISPDTGTVSLIATFERILLDTEITSLAANPWQIFKVSE